MSNMEWKIRLNADFWAELSAILFFSWSFVYTACCAVIESTQVSRILGLCIVYIPLLIACVLKPRKYIKVDAILLLFCIYLLLSISYLGRPQDAFFFERKDYGVWDHVIIPYRGIYAYLFIRLLEDPLRINRVLKRSGWIMLVYFLYTFYKNTQRGYWYGVSGMDGAAEFSYSVSFGYNVLPFALFFIYDGLKKKNKMDLAVAVIMVILILLGGSRGAVLFLGVFAVLYILTEIQQSKNKVLRILIIAVATVVLYATYESIVLWITELFSSMGFESRFFSKLLEGTISNDNGRDRIWEATIQMIRDNPFGYGAMGSRPVIYYINVAGYPHSIVLELLVDFGVIVGGVILAIMLFHSVRMLFFEKDTRWKGLFLVYFSAACSLFISLTFWSTPTIWVCAGIVVNCAKNKKAEKRL